MTTTTTRLPSPPDNSPPSHERDSEFDLAARRLARRRLDAVSLMAEAGMKPDPWQAEFLDQRPTRALLCISRQAGKSTVGAVAALDQALRNPGSVTLLVSPAQRQSAELLGKVRAVLSAMPHPPQVANESVLSLKLANGSRVLSLPGQEHTIRGFSADLLILDEAARIPDELLEAVRPMLAVTGGRLVAMSTPWGRQGWFYEAWAGVADWARTMVTADECPRITPEFLAEERAMLPEIVYRTEYLCEFSDLAGAVFSSDDIDAALAAGVEVATL